MLNLIFQNMKIKKAVKVISVIKKLRISLPCSSLLIIYNSFVRSHLDDGDISHNQSNNSGLLQKNESARYFATLHVTCAIRGTSEEKLCQ